MLTSQIGASIEGPGDLLQSTMYTLCPTLKLLWIINNSVYPMDYNRE